MSVSNHSGSRHQTHAHLAVHRDVIVEPLLFVLAELLILRTLLLLQAEHDDGHCYG